MFNKLEPGIVEQVYVMNGTDIEKHPLHLGLGATAEIEPEFTGVMEWYESYGQRHIEDGAEGRLVSMYVFTESWDQWEVHPNGSEVVLCTRGRISLLQELPDGTVSTTHLEPGQYAINPPGIWHTADVDQPCTVLFITAGLGTRHRPR